MLSDEQVELILNDILEHGYDFTGYARASIKRRIERLMSLDKIKGYSELRFRFNSNPDYINRFIDEVSVNVTEMFRDPSFYALLRKEIIPKLATNPRIRIWHAGCATGEEVFSMAILLKEENLLHKSIIYATDISPVALDNLKNRFISLNFMRQYSENYLQSGGKQDFSDYYTAKYNHAVINKDLVENVIFSTHNLATDGSFNEFNLIICRNVLIYFNKTLQDKALKLFDDSLSPFGYLALGSRESLKHSSIHHRYEQIENEKIWKKKM